MPSRRKRKQEDVIREVVCNIQPRLRWSQHAINVSIKERFPAEWHSVLKIPFIEDVINFGCFTAYAEWVEERGLLHELAAPPALDTVSSRAERAAALGVQLGAFNSKRALEPMITAGTCEEHFREDR